ncbi:hypothetical protein P7C70_g3338, partial [Phenoliferia sp. Uapishka_3]
MAQTASTSPPSVAPPLESGVALTHKVDKEKPNVYDQVFSYVGVITTLGLAAALSAATSVLQINLPHLDAYDRLCYGAGLFTTSLVISFSGQLPLSNKKFQLNASTIPATRGGARPPYTWQRTLVATGAALCLIRSKFGGAVSISAFYTLHHSAASIFLMALPIGVGAMIGLAWLLWWIPVFMRDK